jgi:hypothetical protein
MNLHEYTTMETRPGHPSVFQNIADALTLFPMATELDTQNQLSSSDTAVEHAEIDGHRERDSGESDPAEDDDEEDDDEDADAEAEEIARRLNDQLWAEINKAQAEAAAANKATTGITSDASIPPSNSNDIPAVASASSSSTTLPHPSSVLDKRVHEALKTMRLILKDVANDPLARATLSETLVPEIEPPGTSVLDAFGNAVAANAIPKNVARLLSHLLVSLARSDALFGALRHSERSSVQLELGKRQRDEQEQDADVPPPKRHFPLPMPQQQVMPTSIPMATPMLYALHTQLDGASRAIISALTGPACPPTGPPSPPLIASIQFPLHQVFLFAMTAVGPARNALQELGGLIQALGVLSGVPIGCSSGPTTTNPWPGHPPGTAVHPCSFPGCGKTFARLYSLRAHARIHTAERPFRCTRCPAAFARNHDLKRHERLHEDRAWQCTGCAKAFSRRDALTRHRNTAAARSSACATADVAEIDVPRGTAGTDDELRRTRMWHEASDVAAAAVAAGASTGGTPDILEEGELPRPVLAAAHEAVIRLHPVLQACVSRALGGGAVPTPFMDASVDPTGGQATLASALARAQAQLSTGGGSAAIFSLTSPSPAASAVGEGSSAHATSAMGTSLYGLSPEQTQMLEQAIASAASAAQLQA